MEELVMRSIVESIATRSAIFALAGTLLDAEQEKLFKEKYKKNISAFGSDFINQDLFDEEFLKNNPL